ncbi:ATP-grasp domain-containing protein [Spirosoma koreense]
MILIAGIASEEPVAQVIQSAEKLGVDFAVFNQRDASHYELQVDLDGARLRADLCIAGQWIDLTRIQGMYARLMPVETFPENQINGRPYSLSAEARQRLAFINSLMGYLTDMLPCRMLNRPVDMGSNFSKLYQLAVIREAGLGIPETLITNEAAEVDAFEDVVGPVVFKSISSTRSIVKVLDDNYRTRLSYLRGLPTQFQACLAGNNIRVHVVGNELFAAWIESGSVDYRYASTEGNRTTMRPFDLPESVRNACFRLSEWLNLPLCGIDLFHTHDDDYFCFEVNPSPGYTYFQNETGLPISDAIVRYLETGTAR